jgi:hypothetical protein
MQMLLGGEDREGVFNMSHRIRMLLAAAVAFVAVPGIAAAGGSGGHADDDAAMLADVMRVVHTNFATYNDERWDEFALTYATDAVFLFQNQDPVRGRDAITETHRRVRDVFGPVDLDSIEVVRARADAKLAHLVYTFTARSGHVRGLADVFYERQSDGSVVLAVDSPVSGNTRWVSRSRGTGCGRRCGWPSTALILGALEEHIERGGHGGVPHGGSRPPPATNRAAAIGASGAARPLPLHCGEFGVEVGRPDPCEAVGPIADRA